MKINKLARKLGLGVEEIKPVLAYMDIEENEVDIQDISTMIFYVRNPQIFYHKVYGYGSFSTTGYPANGNEKAKTENRRDVVKSLHRLELDKLKDLKLGFHREVI